MAGGGSRKRSKGNAVRARVVRNAAAAPATVGGESPTVVPLGTLAFLGRWSEAMPQARRPATAGVTRARIGRGVSMMPSRWRRILRGSAHAAAARGDGLRCCESVSVPVINERTRAGMAATSAPGHFGPSRLTHWFAKPVLTAFFHWNNRLWLCISRPLLPESQPIPLRFRNHP
jgi:hypothetical protein